MMPSKKSTLAFLAGMAFLMTACSGLKTSSTTGGSTSGSGATYTVSGSVTGLTGSGMQLVDSINGTTSDALSVAAGATTFTFATTVPSGQTFSVTVKTQPTGPAQTCTVANGSGTATANVASVQVTCGSDFTIGGTVTGLQGSGLVLEDNGGDNLTIAGTGTVTFTFKTQQLGYNVTVLTQPSNPTQTCAVLGGQGTATANVTSVQINCGAVYTIGGSVTGLAGSGLVLTDTLGTVQNTLAINGTGTVPFTFNVAAPANSAYAVTVTTQPTNPAQTCSVVNGSGTATGSVTTVQVVCPAPAWTIGGTVVGLVNGPGDTVELINNGGDNILVTGNNQGFVFPTSVTNEGQYNVQIFLQPTSQPQTCGTFYYLGVATANVDSVIVDCQHNDWTWMFGPDTNGTYGPYGLAQIPPPPPPTFDTNSPGGRDFAAAWAEPKSPRKWMFGGYGMVTQGVSPPFLPGLLSDLWVFWPGYNGQTGVWIPANLPITTTSVTSGGITTVTNVASTVPLQYPGTFFTGPNARWGSVTWTDSAGNFYLFGGESGAGLMNDIWKFTPGKYDTSYSTPTLIYIGSYTYTGAWTSVSSGAATNYGTLGSASASNHPGPRWGAAYCTDANGTVWMFGGQGADSNGSVGLLNDLWTYSNGVWTWMGPTNSSVSQNDGVYGTQGTAATGNAPGGRQTAVLWADNNGGIWLFGGLGLDSVGTENPGNTNTLPNGTTPEGALLNDLWKFDTGTGQWTWMSGGGATGLANQIGTYGTQQVPAAGDIPGSRWSAAGWSDSNGNLWFFGGWGYASSLAQSTGFLDDIWEYHPSTGLWTWWKGSSNVNQAGSYPTQFADPLGLPFVNNQPGGRRGVALWPQDSLDYVWMFGGQGYDSVGANGYAGEMWTYLPFPY